MREKFRTYVVVILEEKEKQSRNVERAVCRVFRTHVVVILGKRRNKNTERKQIVTPYLLPSTPPKVFVHFTILPKLNEHNIRHIVYILMEKCYQQFNKSFRGINKGS